MTVAQRLRDLLIVGVAFSLGLATLMACTTIRIWQVGQQDGRRQVDAIVVLGAAQYNGRPSAVLAARLDHAIDLYKAGYAPYLITTGGKLTGDVYTEAQTGATYAQKRGVPKSALLMEDTGRSTLESIQNVRAVFDAHGLKTALFVSDRSHMLRVLRLAQDQGIDAWASPTTTSPDDIDSDLIYNSMFHEVGAMTYSMLVTDDPEAGAPSTSPSATPSAARPAAPTKSLRP